MIPNQRSSREEGFTLIELLMAITISGVILSALAMGFIVALRGTAGAHDRFVASNGNHTLATYFSSDVHGANPTMVSTAAVDSGCATTPAGTTNVLRLQWTELLTPTKMNAFSVSYRTRQAGSDWQLVRYACSGTQDPYTTAAAILSAATPTEHIMVAQLYNPSTAPYRTEAVVSGREITLKAFAALGQGESTPYAYTLSAGMRTLSGGATSSSSTTSTSSTTTTSTSTTTTTSSTTTTTSSTTTTTAPATATKVVFYNCTRSSTGAAVDCNGPIDLAKDEYVTMQVRLESASGTAVNSTSNRTVNLSSSSNSFDLSVESIQIPSGSSTSASFRLTHTSAGGSGTVTAASTGLTSDTVNVT